MPPSHYCSQHGGGRATGQPPGVGFRTHLATALPAATCVCCPKPSFSPQTEGSSPSVNTLRPAACLAEQSTRKSDNRLHSRPSSLHCRTHAALSEQHSVGNDPNVLGRAGQVHYRASQQHGQILSWTKTRQQLSLIHRRAQITSKRHRKSMKNNAGHLLEGEGKGGRRRSYYFKIS